MPIASSIQPGWKHWRFDLCFSLLVLVLCILFAHFIIGNMSDPLFGGGDVALWGDNAWYVGTNARLLPFPSFDLINDQAFYPYGTNQVFCPWGLERDLLVAFMNRWFGFGPWIQVYLLLSLAVIALGSYGLLRREHGKWLAAGAGILLAFGNYYAIAKFPGHTNMACVHWTTLNLVADYLLLRRFLRKEDCSACLLLLKAVLLVLALGQDLGYVAGYALSSFAIIVLFIVIVDAWRHKGKMPWNPRRLAHWWKLLCADAREHRARLALLSAIGVIAAFIYIPLVAQIMKAAGYFNISEIPQHGVYVNPIRMLAPIFPGLKPNFLKHVLGMVHDKPEGLFAAQPGWFFLIGGIMGVVFMRKNRSLVVPWIVLMVLCLFHNPPSFPMLGIFPWSSFSRVSGRASVIYPVMLCLLSLELYNWAMETHRRRLVPCLMGLLLVVEASTAYTAIKERKVYFTPDPGYYDLMDEVRQSPGEAVLDWPFCVAAGNGVPARMNLSAFYYYQAAVGAQRQFHGKKVVGYYFGRLHPSQIRPFLNVGWNRMFFPDTRDIFNAGRQTRDFSPEEWTFFERFYLLNDFCGVLLYPELLPKRTVDEFHRRFGTPVARAAIPRAGIIEFIPKPAQWRSQVNKEKGRVLTLKAVNRFPSTY